MTRCCELRARTAIEQPDRNPAASQKFGPLADDSVDGEVNGSGEALPAVSWTSRTGVLSAALASGEPEHDPGRAGAPESETAC
jgi:hypothetical protein